MWGYVELARQSPIVTYPHDRCVSILDSYSIRIRAQPKLQAVPSRGYSFCVFVTALSGRVTNLRNASLFAHICALWLTSSQYMGCWHGEPYIIQSTPQTKVCEVIAFPGCPALSPRLPSRLRCPLHRSASPEWFFQINRSNPNPVARRLGG